MSTPKRLRGELTGSTSRGVSLELLPPAVASAHGGRVMERGVWMVPLLVALPVALQVMLEGGSRLVRQLPAVLTEVAGLLQQAQAGQPGVRRALAEQQQPLWHMLVLQSKALPQGSPGESCTQEPEPGAQALQLLLRALALQMKPPLQAAEGAEQGRPGEAACAGPEST